MSAENTLTIFTPAQIAEAVAAEVRRMGLTASPEWVTAAEIGKRLGFSRSEWNETMKLKSERSLEHTGQGSQTT